MIALISTPIKHEASHLHLLIDKLALSVETTTESPFRTSTCFPGLPSRTKTAVHTFPQHAMIFLTFIGVTILASTAATANHDSIVATYKFTPEELQAFTAKRQLLDPSYQPFPWTAQNSTKKTSEPPETAEKPRGIDLLLEYPHQGTSEADCLYHNHRVHGQFFEYHFNRARCVDSGSLPNYIVNCSTSYSWAPDYVHWWHVAPTFWRHRCPDPLICVNFNIDDLNWVLGTAYDFEYEDIWCIHPHYLHVTQHSAVAHNAPGSTENPILCSGDQMIPGPNFPFSWQSANFLLTVQVAWGNGSTYKAPKMYIRDSPQHSRYGFDRAFKTGTDIISTIITVGSFRGRLQSRSINFCLEMLHGNSWTVMTYTWFKLNHRFQKWGGHHAAVDFTPAGESTADSNATVGQ